ncbi:MAG: hypothetical protein JXQ96_01875 [Cyclobacteriaceae bacterium]
MEAIIAVSGVTTFIIMIIGLIKPSLVLKWDNKPTRGKVFLYSAAALLLINITEQYIIPPSDPYQAAIEAWREGDYHDARDLFLTVEPTDSSYRMAQTKIVELENIIDQLAEAENKQRTKQEEEEVNSILETLEDPERTAKILVSLSDEEVKALENGKLKRVFSENRTADSLYHIRLADNLDIRESLVREEKDKIRKAKIKDQFGWGGRHNMLSYEIKDNMHDPGSFEHVETTYRDKGNHLLVSMKFRGSNAFGALVLNQVTARVGIENGIVLEILSSKVL